MKVLRLFAVCALVVTAVPGLHAADVDPMTVIGMDLKTAAETFGLPQSIFPFRGTSADRDDVVFFFPDHFYLFWFRDRVWQVRFDMRYAGTVLGLALGMSRDQIQMSSTRQLLPAGDSLYFDIDSAGYPVRVRLVFALDRLSDVYVYRSDF
jgi:hypothetical protein